MLRLLGCLNGESAALTSSPNIVASRYPHMCKSCSPFWNRLKMNKICNNSRTQCGNQTIFLSPRFSVKSILAKRNSTNGHFNNFRGSEFRFQKLPFFKMKKTWPTKLSKWPFLKRQICKTLFDGKFECQGNSRISTLFLLSSTLFRENASLRIIKSPIQKSWGTFESVHWTFDISIYSRIKVNNMIRHNIRQSWQH